MPALERGRIRSLREGIAAFLCVLQVGGPAKGEFMIDEKGLKNSMHFSLEVTVGLS